MKRTWHKIIAFVLVLTLMIPTLASLSVFAEETDSQTKTVELLKNEERTFNGTSSTTYASNETAAVIKDAGNARITYSFKATSAPGTIYGAVAFNDSSNVNKYVMFYLKPNNTIGVEIRGNSTTDVNVTIPTSTVSNIYDGQWHTVVFEVKKNKYYSFSVDGTEVLKRESTDTKFLNNIGISVDKFSVGGSQRGGSSEWLFSGSMKDIKVENLDPVPVSAVVQYDGNSKVASADVEKITALEKGAVATAFKLDAGKTGDVALFTVGSQSLTVNPATGEIKFGNAKVSGNKDRISDTTQWHTLVANCDGSQLTFVLDGTEYASVAYSGLFADSNADKATIGDCVSNVMVFPGILAEEQLAEVVGETSADIISAKGEGYYDFYRQSIMMMGDEKSSNYRIPSLVQAGNVTIAAIDERKGGSGDQGAIDLQIRRSFDNGKTWEEQVTVSEFGKPVNASFQSRQPLHIDPCLAYDEANDVVYLVMDMFPESAAAMDMSAIKDGSGFFTATIKETGKSVRMQALNTVQNGGNGNVRYGLIQDRDEDGNVLESATVYAPNDDNTYSVSKTYFVSDYSYGQLMKDPNNNGNYTQEAGNIFVYTTDNKGELSVTCTMYVWFYESHDKGETWSNPVNISGFDGCKQEWMRFCGTAPGSGIVIKGGTHDGRIVFPCYFTNNAQTGLSSQSSAAFYSDDGGKTWKIGESVNEIRLNTTDNTAIQKFSGGNQTTENSIVQVSENGKLRIYCRNTGGRGKVVTAVSTDGGVTWQAPDGRVTGSDGSNFSTFPDSCYEPLTEVYCQLAAITYHDKQTGKYYVIISNPLGSGRNNLGIHVRELDYKTGEYATGSEWITKQIGNGPEAYSALTQLSNGNIGLFWELTRLDAYYDMPFQEFSLAYLLSNDLLWPTEIDQITGKVIKAEGSSDDLLGAGDKVRFTVTTYDPVYITGTPKLKLNIGGTLGNFGTTISGGTEKTADYVSGSGTTALVFEYTVTSKDAGNISAYGEIISDENNRAENAFCAEFKTMSPRYTTVTKTGIAADNDGYDIAAVGASAGSVHSNSSAANVIDNNPSTIWHTAYSTSGGANIAADSEKWVMLDLGSEQSVNSLRYLPRQDNSSNGRIFSYEVYAVDGNGTETLLTSGDWTNDASWKIAEFAEVSTRYIKLLATSSYGGWVCCSELRAAYAAGAVPPTPEYTLGDVNDNGNINAEDAALILQYFADINDDIIAEAADVNGDENINAADAALILQCFADIIDIFPAQA